MQSKMLYKMCHEILNKTDMKAIRKARGFPVEANESKSLLESVFLSTIGVAAAMNQLTSDEVALLHLLNLIDEPVNVEFFARIYGDSRTKGDNYYTFTQKYMAVFKRVQRALIRKGILLVAEIGYGDTKLERMRFQLPNDFKAFLPSLFPAAKNRVLEGAGDANQIVLRQKIMTSLKNNKMNPKFNETYRVKVSSGTLYFGDKRFSLQRLQEWQQYNWAPAIPSISYPSNNIKDVKPLEFIYYIFAQLKPNEWLLASELTLFLEMFYHKHTNIPQATEVCERGWRWGCLAKQKVEENVYYRLAPPLQSKDPQVSPDTYLSVTDKGLVKVDLQTIPYEALESLIHISNLKVKQNCLTISADLNKFSEAPDALRNHALSIWLRDNTTEFKEMMALIDERWGKQIVHDNLFVARIRDLTLKVRLQQAFPDPKQLIMLSNEFIAFPRGLLPEIEKVVKKTGNVIKMVK